MDINTIGDAYGLFENFRRRRFKFFPVFRGNFEMLVKASIVTVKPIGQSPMAIEVLIADMGRRN